MTWPRLQSSSPSGWISKKPLKERSNSRKKKDEENRAKQEKARRVNKPPFRP